MKDAILWKRILNENFDSDCHFQDTPLETIFNRVMSSPIIISSASDDRESPLPKWNQMRNLAIPFPSFFIEYKTVGQFDDGTIAEIASGSLCSFNRENRRLTIIGMIGRTQNPPEILGRVSTELDADFSIITKDDGSLLRAIIEPTIWYQNALRGDQPAIAKALCHPLALVCEGLMLLGCKNVSLEPRDNDPKQVRKAIKRHGGNADKYRYHVLVVKPPGARSDAKGVEIGIMPRHVCRGHFSEYGPEFGKGLLFGRYAGRFYIPPHLKGDKKNGEVAKDYAIAAPVQSLPRRKTLPLAQ